MIVGSAEVVIRAIGNKLESDIQKSLTSAGKKAEGSGKDAGANYSKGFNSSIGETSDKMLQPVKDSMDKAGKEAGESAGEQITEGIERKVKEASPQISNAGNGIGNRLGNKMSDGFAKSRFLKTLSHAALKIGILVPIVGAVVGAVGALVSGLFAVGAAVGSASQSLVVLPALAFAAIGAMATLKLAFSGVGKALKVAFDPTATPEALKKAMEKLTPEARKFVTELSKMKGGLKELKSAAGEKLFPKLTRALEIMSKSNLFSTLKKGLKQTGSAIGDAGKSIAKAMSTDAFSKNLGDVMKSNGDVIRLFGQGLGSLAQAFLALMSAARPITLEFATWFRDWSAHLSTITDTKGEIDGLTDTLSGSASIMKLLIRITKNLFGSMFDIGKLAKPVGVDLLQAFEKSTKKMREFINSAKGSAKIKKYFDDVKPNVLAVSDLVGKLGLAFLRLGASPGIKATADAFAKIIPDIEKALDAGTRSIGPKIAVLVGEIAKMFTALEESGAIAAVINIFIGLAKAITFLVNAPVLGPIIKSFLLFAAAYKTLMLVAKLGAMSFAGPIAGLMGLGRATTFYNTAFKAGVSPALATQGLIQNSKGFGLAGLAARDAGRHIDRTNRSMAKLGTTAGGAHKGVSAFRGGMLRTAGTIGLLGAVSSGAATKVGLTNTAMGAMVGTMVEPGFGTAIGATIGFFIDVATYAGPAAKSIQAANDALKSGDLFTKKSALAGLNADLDKLQKKDFSWVEKVKISLKNPGNSGFGGALNRTISKEQKTVEGKKRQLKLDMEIQMRSTVVPNIINAAEVLDQVRDFMKSIKTPEDKRKVTLDYRVAGGKETLSLLGNLSASIRDLPKGSTAWKAVNKSFDNIGKKAGLTTAGTDLLKDSLAGVPLAFNDIPDDKKIKISADEKKALASLGITSEAIDKVVKPHNAKVDVLKAPSFASELRKIQGDLDKTEKPRVPMVKKIDTMGFDMSLSEIKDRLVSFKKPIVAKFKAFTEDAAPKVAELVAKAVKFKNKTAKFFADVKEGGLKDLLGKIKSFKGKTQKVIADVKNNDKVRGIIASVKAFKGKVQKIIGNVTGNDKVRGIIASVKAFKGKAQRVIANVSGEGKVRGLISSIKGLVGKTVGVGVSVGIHGASLAIKALGKVFGFSKGGYVNGLGSSVSDSIPAMLSNGEFVINAAQTKKYRKLLESVNAGKSPARLLPQISRSVMPKASSSKAQSSGLQLIGGKLSIDENGQHFITGVAQSIYDGNASYDDTVRKMG